MTMQPEFANDLLRGASEIAEFLFGSPDHRRKVFHLVEKTRFPHFRLGSLICARRSVITEWIKEQEQRGKTGFRTPPSPRQGPGDKGRSAAGETRPQS